MALLSVKNLQKSYRLPNDQKQEVLRDVNIEFKSGDLVALLGESGCGKSTLINILGGLDTDYTGSVVLHQDYLQDFNEKQMNDYRKKRVGLIFQNYELIPSLTIKENVEIAMSISNIDKEQANTRAIELLTLVGLSEFASKYPNQLSGGQKQRVAIARSLANNPTIILADEPTGALDSQSAEIVMNILTKIAESGKLVIMVTHSQKVANSCSRIIKMENGEISSDKNNINMKIAATRDKHITPKNMSSKKLFTTAFKNIKQSRARSLMISCGMGIAMTVVLLILCLSTGFASYINTMQAEQGATSLQIHYEQLGTISTSNIETVSGLDGVETVVESHTGYNLSSILDSSIYTIYSLYSINSNTPSFDMLLGNTPTSGTTEIIINETFASDLTSTPYALIGQALTINSNTFEIVGIYSDTLDVNSAYIRSTAMTSATSLTDINTLTVKITDITYLSQISKQASFLGFNVYQTENNAEELLTYVDLATTVLVAVAGISLLVCALMTIIVLTISITERKREIGIMRAIGASRSNIVTMFLFESILIGLLAGALTIVATPLLTTVVNLISIAATGYTFISYNFIYYISCFAITVAISVLAGISPAFRASYLDPVECLRSE